MNFNIRKKFFLDEDDLSVYDGPRLLFKVSELKQGLFVYNKSGEGIAQIVFQKKYGFITIRADEQSSLPIRIIKKGSKFYAEFYDYTVQGTNFRKAKKNPENRMLIVGNPKKYSYKFVEDAETLLSVTNSNENFYNIDISSEVNNLKFLLTVIAIEKMIFDY